MKYLVKKNMYKNTLDENILNTFFQYQQTIKLAGILREEIFELSKEKELSIKNQIILRSTLKQISRYIETLSTAITPISTEIANRGLVVAEHTNKAPKIQAEIYSNHNTSQEHLHACIKLIENIESMSFRLESTHLSEETTITKKSLQSYIKTAHSRQKLLDTTLQNEQDEPSL